MSVLTSPLDLPVGRLLALDLGQVRIGVAVCDEAGMLASPLTVVRRHPTRAEDFAEIAALVARERAVGVVIGMPANEGDERQARWARRYGGRLAGSLAVPAVFWDETLSTVEASRLVAEGGGRTPLDAAAAAVILNDYLDARRASTRTE